MIKHHNPGYVVDVVDGRMIMSVRFNEDDRVADLETGELGTVVATPIVMHAGGTQRAYVVMWDGSRRDTDLVRGDTLRAATVTEGSQQ